MIEVLAILPWTFSFKALLSYLSASPYSVSVACIPLCAVKVQPLFDIEEKIKRIRFRDPTCYIPPTKVLSCENLSVLHFSNMPNRFGRAQPLSENARYEAFKVET